MVHAANVRASTEFHHGKYFSSTLAASRHYGYRTDKIGRMLRKRKGKTDEGMLIPGSWPILTAKKVYESGWPSMRRAFRREFPSVFPDLAKPPRKRSKAPRFVLDFAI
jgi:hypothetical protein